MIKFFNYCFYRISTTKYFQKVDPKAPFIWAFGWTTFCELANIMTVINTYHLFNNSTFDAESWIWPITIPLSIINILFFLNERKYKYLLECYKDEKHKTLKGWGVFLYVIGSFILFLYTSYKLFWVPKIDNLPW